MRASEMVQSVKVLAVSLMAQVQSLDPYGIENHGCPLTSASILKHSHLLPPQINKQINKCKSKIDFIHILDPLCHMALVFFPLSITYFLKLIAFSFFQILL